MDFPRVENALELCANHLDHTGTRNTPVEAVLVGYLLTITYAEYERAVRQLVSERGDLHGDHHLSAFMSWASERLIRSIAIGEIARVLGRFDDACLAAFKFSVHDTPIQVAFDNIVNNRHDVAHRLGARITLAEFETNYRASLPIFDAIQDALSA